MTNCGKVKRVSKEVAASYLSVKVQGDKIARLRTAGPYRVVMAQLVHLVVSVMDVMEKAYKVPIEDSVGVFAHALDKAVNKG